MTSSALFSFFTKLFGGKVVFNAKTRLPETALSVRVADKMRTHALEGRYHGVFGHIANEGKRAPRNGWMMKAMGMVPGTYDWNFTFRTAQGELRVLLIELKVRNGDSALSPAQVLFGQWCDMSAIPRAICRSVEEVEAELRKHGALRG